MDVSHVTRRRLLWAGGLAALASSGPAVAQAASAQASAALVGISMPTRSSARWFSDGENIERQLAALGHRTELAYADDQVPQQIRQIEQMLEHGARVLVIAAIDASALTAVLAQAHERQVAVIAYDRLIRNSPYVDYYATFDNFQVGVLQASSIVDKLGLKGGKGPFNIELFGGSPDDNNAFFFYDGAMSVLKPYLDSGQLVVRSKQIGMDKVSTRRWASEIARARMVELLNSTYAKERLHAVLSPYDGLSIGILSALRGVGYCATPQQPCPVLTGQDAEIPSMRALLRGQQSSTVFKDTRELAKVAAHMVAAVLAGRPPELNDSRSYHNGSKLVPAYLLKPVLVDERNWRAVLLASGYYKEAQLR
jgi:putative multiple sugar transport system substrate-binding protein